jgi:MFS family permease
MQERRSKFDLYERVFGLSMSGQRPPASFPFTSLSAFGSTLPPSRWALFRRPGFAPFVAARLGSTLAIQIQGVAVGWQVYDITGDPFDLGLVGLAQFLPSILLVLLTGTVADRFERRIVMAVSLVGQAVCALLLVTFALLDIDVVWPILLVLVGFGTARAFLHPAQQSLVPNLVPAEELSRAIAATTALVRIGMLAGPLAGGLLYEVSAATPYIAAAAVVLGSLACTLVIPATAQRIAAAPDWRALSAGFRYIWKERIVLGAISLDLFAVLLGGAVALLPVYARDILEVGPWGLGLLRGAPGLGGIAMAIYLSVYPIRDHAGLIMFATVALFGLSIVAFGLSTALWLSLAALVVMGASDLVSVYIRATLVQLWTPDQLRGRVSAVNTVFLNASNEIGAFRAGGTAALIGAAPAVVLGGLGAVLVTALWFRWFPELRAVRHLDGRI